ncbi:MAG: hypothetical protein ACT4QD_23920 [Acidobacteriota bacterium]
MLTRRACSLIPWVGILAAVASAAPLGDTVDLAATLDRVSARVERFFVRARSLVCLEKVQLQPLGTSLSPDGFGRVVESELRLTWDPADEASARFDASTLRKVLRVNGRLPKAKDPRNCTAPEQNDSEEQPLSMLLAGERAKYHFTFAGERVVDGRAALMIDYRSRARATVEVTPVEDNELCVSFSIEGGQRGRIWIDRETYDVLRLDQSLSTLVDIPLPQKLRLWSPEPRIWTLDRLDTSIRFEQVSFEDPQEALLLPVKVSSLRITRGSGMPRLRTTTEYSNYRRFLTSGRVLKG